MPGYNHYDSCTCGWCFKLGRGRFRGQELLAAADVYSAKRFLGEHGALRSVTACYVNPNATCPVCSASVFFYQNRFGSRVFFDELGPPWPKHPCTDNGTARTHSNDASNVRQVVAPRRRSRGLMLELLEARTKVRIAAQPFDTDRLTDVWTLVEVTSVQRNGWRNQVDAEVLGDPSRRRVAFGFDSSTAVLEVGTVGSLSEREFSAFDSEAMKPRRYKLTGPILDRGDGSEPETQTDTSSSA